jgi:hypothetical protein
MADWTAGPALEAGTRVGGWRQLTRRPNKRAAAADFFEPDGISNPIEAEAKRIKAADSDAGATIAAGANGKRFPISGQRQLLGQLSS